MKSTPANKMILCSECKAEVASSALVCPKCGHRFVHKSKISLIIGTIFLLLGIINIIRMNNFLEMRHYSEKSSFPVIEVIFDSSRAYENEKIVAIINLAFIGIGLFAITYGSGIRIKK